KQWEANQEKLNKQDEKAKIEGKLVGRIIEEPFADSHATYEIIKENKKTVKIKVCVGLGDDWVIPYWGNEATIKKDFVLSKFNYADRITEMLRR
ncbi:MAG: hypothetical protein IIB31_01660, partial [Chloroflexi bacterium]|nr:hypothetical protein [Chloroflexota bacterium]